MHSNHAFEPRFRATIAGDQLTLTSWHPGLYSAGPVQEFLRRRAQDGVIVADFTQLHGEEGGRELVVSFPVGCRDADRVREIIVSWAGAVGHRRVWLEDDVIELADPAPVGTAAVTCPTCRHRWVDAQAAFWAAVRQHGHFPGFCPICGSGLPEWSVIDGHDGPGAADADSRHGAATASPAGEERG